ncbi:hypothetical protein AVEN_133019-1, partial [Araneus ventricosus]
MTSRFTSPDSSKGPPSKWSENLTSRQKMLPNVPKQLWKQHSHFSSVFAPRMSLHNEVPFSNGFRDYHFWTILHRKGMSGNERISGVL